MPSPLQSRSCSFQIGAPLGAANRRNVLADQDQLRVDDAATRARKSGRRAVVDRHDDDADEQAAPEGDDPLGAVLAEEDDLVALDDA